MCFVFKLRTFIAGKERALAASNAAVNDNGSAGRQVSPTSTKTVYGFLDFTTIVSDTMMIFKPSKAGGIQLKFDFYSISFCRIIKLNWQIIFGQVTKRGTLLDLNGRLLPFWTSLTNPGQQLAIERKWRPVSRSLKRLQRFNWPKRRATMRNRAEGADLYTEAADSNRPGRALRLHLKFTSKEVYSTLKNRPLKRRHAARLRWRNGWKFHVDRRPFHWRAKVPIPLFRPFPSSRATSTLVPESTFTSVDCPRYVNN